MIGHPILMKSPELLARFIEQIRYPLGLGFHVAAILCSVERVGKFPTVSSSKSSPMYSSTPEMSLPSLSDAPSSAIFKSLDKQHWTKLRKTHLIHLNCWDKMATALQEVECNLILIVWLNHGKLIYSIWPQHGNVYGHCGKYAPMRIW